MFSGMSFRYLIDCIEASASQELIATMDAIREETKNAQQRLAPQALYQTHCASAVPMQ
jgi:hypothetical protein